MNNSLNTALTRRKFLRTSLLTAGIASPFTTNIASPTLSGSALAPAPRPKRAIFVYTPQGAPYDYWTPDGCGNSFTLRQASAPLEPVKEHCVFFRKFFVENAGHGITDKVLGGGFTAGRETTLDIRLGEMLSDNVMINNLLLATHVPSFEVVSKKENQLQYFFDSSARAYREFFGDRYVDPAIASPLDRRLLAANPDALNDFDKNVDLQIMLSALALQRNITNVVTLMWSDNQAGFYLPESYSTKYRLDFHHAVSSLASVEAFVYFRAYLSMKLAYLIKLLEITPDHDGRSILDSTLVVHVTDMGDGRDHTGDNAPYLIAGCKHLFRNGLVLDVDRANQYDLMDTIALAYGLQDIQYGSRLIDDILI